MKENSQWQAFVETGDIRYYLQYKALQIAPPIQQQKELADGRNSDTSIGITRSEV